MDETAEDRLERLRREVMSESPATTLPAPPPSAPAPSAASILRPPVAAAHPPAAHPPAAIPATTPPPAAPTPPTPDGGAPDASSDGWSIGEAIGEIGTGRLVGIGLVILGVYLLASQFIPFLGVIGSILILAAGLVLLAVHFQGRSGAWALYAGAVLTAVGAARSIEGLIPFVPSRGLTSLALGIAFLAIGVLRHSQAGGYGWQAVVGVVFLGWGLIQFVLGLIPGSPGLLDLVVPILLLAAGAVILMRAYRRPSDSGVSP